MSWGGRGEDAGTMTSTVSDRQTICEIIRNSKESPDLCRHFMFPEAVLSSSETIVGIFITEGNCIVQTLEDSSAPVGIFIRWVMRSVRILGTHSTSGPWLGAEDTRIFSSPKRRHYNVAFIVLKYFQWGFLLSSGLKPYTSCAYLFNMQIT